MSKITRWVSWLFEWLRRYRFGPKGSPIDVDPGVGDGIVGSAMKW